MSEFFQNNIVESLDIFAELNEIRRDINLIKERLAIIDADKYFLIKYPALKEAYDHYKTVEALIKESHGE